MAIARVRINTRLFNAGFVNSFTLDVSSVAEGNLLLGIVATTNNDVASGALFSTPAGWTKIGEAGNNGANASECNIAVYQKIAGASESDPTITVTSTTRAVTALIEYSGVDGTTPINQSLFGETTTGSTSQLQALGVTTDEDDCVIVAPFSIPDPSTGPFGISGTGWAEIIDAQSGGSSFESALVVGEKTMSGQGATLTCNMDPTSNTEGAWAQIALAPAAAAAPGVSIPRAHPQLNRRVRGRR